MVKSRKNQQFITDQDVRKAENRYVFLETSSFLLLHPFVIIELLFFILFTTYFIQSFLVDLNQLEKIPSTHRIHTRRHQVLGGHSLSVQCGHRVRPVRKQQCEQWYPAHGCYLFRSMAQISCRNFRIVSIRCIVMLTLQRNMMTVFEFPKNASCFVLASPLNLSCLPFFLSKPGGNWGSFSNGCVVRGCTWLPSSRGVGAISQL